MIQEKPLTQSLVSDRIWSLAGEDLDEFKAEVKRYFAIAYPGFTPVDFNFEKRIIWLRDDR